MRHSLRNILSGVTVVLAVIAVLVLASISRAQPLQESGPSKTPAGDAANGRKVFNAVGCWQCHGFSAQGSSAGPKLGPDPISYAAFAGYLRVPKGEMPPYTSKVLSETQVADIYAFLKALPAARNAKDIPMLSPK